MRIALDAMGGDFAPDATVAGALLAAHSLPPGVTLVLVGQRAALEAQFDQHGGVPPSIELVHAPDTVGMGEHPTKALTQKPHSSIGVGFQLLKAGQVDAFCGAGNTGAMHVGAMFSIKPIEGIIRPAIAGFAPQPDGGQAVLIDVGANADCKPEMLAQFAEIGSVYARSVWQIERPRVGLLNLGEEEQKGSLVAQAAHQLLKVNPRQLNFIGNLEGRDVFANKADVIVCDGFTGNVVLKLAESIYDLLKERRVRDPFFDRLNYEAIGGSPILGVNGTVVIGHGVSTPLAISNMLHLATHLVTSQVHLKIKEALG